MGYCSQHGEDFLIFKLFSDAKQGYFVEVGCIDGKRFSNTLFLEEQGWKGICMEAHNDYIDFLHENRPNSLIVHAAAGETDASDVTFYANARGSLSSLDKSTEERWKRDYGKWFTGFEEQIVEKLSLNTVFSQASLGKHDIDVVSIDVEGYEAEVLAGLDLDLYRPKLLVIEFDSKEHLELIRSRVEPHGYKLNFVLRSNMFFMLNGVDFPELAASYDEVLLYNYGNPIDKDPDSTLIVDLALKQSETYGVPEYLMKKSKRQLSPLMSLGFHGDKYLLDVVDYLMQQDVEAFIETGTNVGTSLVYLSTKYPNILCISCEPDKHPFNVAQLNTAHNKNVQIYQQLSQEFIYEIDTNYSHLYDKKVLIWLDAHGYGFEWPLKEEINFVLKKFKNAFILIDDFKVPHIPEFGYDEYKDQICSLEFIKDSIPHDADYALYYPNYTEKTSAWHPLRGWGLFITGANKLSYKNSLESIHAQFDHGS